MSDARDKRLPEVCATDDIVVLRSAKPVRESRIGVVASGLRAVVAIPVNNERDRIEACLMALVGQIAADSFGVLLFLNNCTDGTGEVVASVIPHTPFEVRVIEEDHPDASAGWARRKAMDAASDWLAESGRADGVLLTTDADTRVESDWISNNIEYIDTGYDAAAGRFSLDPREAAQLPVSLRARGVREAEYEALLTEIEARLDPQPLDPWPRHWTQSGASLAVRRSCYESVGGIPNLALGEDKAFVELLKANDLHIRHAPDIKVITSGRLDGRAAGGAADTMKLRCQAPESPCDDRLERIDRALFRFIWQRVLRRAHAEGELRHAWLWSILLSIPASKLQLLVRLQSHGKARAAIEAASPRLAYRALSPSRLPRQIASAKVLLGALRRRTLTTRRPASSVVGDRRRTVHVATTASPIGNRASIDRSASIQGPT